MMQINPPVIKIYFPLTKLSIVSAEERLTEKENQILLDAQN